MARLKERSGESRLRLSGALSVRAGEDADQSGETFQVFLSPRILPPQDVTLHTGRVRSRGRGVGDVERHDGSEDGFSGHGDGKAEGVAKLPHTLRVVPARVGQQDEMARPVEGEQRLSVALQPPEGAHHPVVSPLDAVHEGERRGDLGRRLADTLVQVWRRDGTDVWVLIHIEVQGTPERDFAQRMFVYYYRIFDRYERPIMSVAILADEQANWRPARFEQDLWGCAVEMRYPIIKLLDWRTRDEELAASANPFAVVVRAYLAAQDTVGAAEARGRAKIGLIRGLYGQGYERGLVLELLRLIDWLVALPPEQERLVERELEQIEEEQRMAYVTSWERMGVVDGQRMALLRMVRARFGTVPEALDRRIAEADQDALDSLVDRVSTATSLAELADESSDTA